MTPSNQITKAELVSDIQASLARIEETKIRRLTDVEMDQSRVRVIEPIKHATTLEAIMQAILNIGDNIAAAALMRTSLQKPDNCAIVWLKNVPINIAKMFLDGRYEGAREEIDFTVNMEFNMKQGSVYCIRQAARPEQLASVPVYTDFRRQTGAATWNALVLKKSASELWVLTYWHREHYSAPALFTELVNQERIQTERWARSEGGDLAALENIGAGLDEAMERVGSYRKNHGTVGPFTNSHPTSGVVTIQAQIHNKYEEPKQIHALFNYYGILMIEQYFSQRKRNHFEKDFESKLKQFFLEALAQHVHGTSTWRHRGVHVTADWSIVGDIDGSFRANAVFHLRSASAGELTRRIKLSSPGICRELEARGVEVPAGRPNIHEEKMTATAFQKLKVPGFHNIILKANCRIRVVNQQETELMVRPLTELGDHYCSRIITTTEVTKTEPSSGSKRMGRNQVIRELGKKRDGADHVFLLASGVSGEIFAWVCLGGDV